MKVILPVLAGAIAFTDVVSAHCMPLTPICYIDFNISRPLDLSDRKRRGNFALSVRPPKYQRKLPRHLRHLQ